MNDSKSNRTEILVRHWSFDDLGTRLTEGTIHPDEVSLSAVWDEERKKDRSERAVMESIYDDPNWDPPYTNVAEDF
jgi:hypothetical protein